MNNYVLNILVLSRNPNLYSTKSIVAAGEKRGHNLYVMDHMDCSPVIINGRFEVYSSLGCIKGIDAIIPRIGVSVSSYGAAVVNQFENQGIFSVVPHTSLGVLRDKYRAHQFFVKNNIPVPNTILVSDDFNLDHLIPLLGGYPIILKLLQGTQGEGVILLDNDKTTKSLAQTFLRLKKKFVFQEFISESNGEDIRIIIVNNQVVASMKRSAQKGDFRSNLHQGGTSEQVEITNEEHNIALKIAKIMNLKVAGIDILRSKRGPLVLEVNASPGLEGIETTTEIDIAGKIIELIEENVD